MADPGWYPDPGGSGQFRFWNGRQWGTDLSATREPPAPQRPGERRRRGSPAGIIAAVVAIVLVITVVLVVVWPRDRAIEITDNPPTPTVSAGDDGEPSPTPGDTPTPPPPSSASPSGGAVACPDVEDVRRDYPDDGRVHGGRMSFAQIPGWNDARDGGLSWADDDATQRISVNGGWFNLATVGALRPEDGFGAPQAAAKSATECMVTSSGWYPRPTRIEVVASKAMTVSGRKAYIVATDVYEPADVTDDPKILGDRVTVVVVDTGGGRLGILVTTGSLGVPDVLDATAAALTSLRVD